MQKVQMEEIVLWFLYKNTNSFNITKNVMLQPKIVCKVYASNRAIVTFYTEYYIEYLKKYYVTKY